MRARISWMLMSAAVVAPLLAGCGSTAGHRGKARSASLSEFASAGPAAAVAAIEVPAPSEVEPEGASEVVVDAPPPIEPPSSFQTAPSRLRHPGDRVILNSLIGQINGRPIFADDFFSPVEDQIVAARREVPPSEFRRVLEMLISRRLRVLVDNELFIADAYAGLTPEQKKGLVALVTQFQEEFIGEAGGGVRSETEAMLAKEGYTIDKLLQERQNVALIQKLRVDRIKPRVIVSWRDVEREYRRRKDEFNPQSIVTIGRMRFSTADEAVEIQQVRERLARGEDFQKIAAAMGDPREGLWDRFPSPTGEPEDVPDLEPLKPWLKDLRVGDVSDEFQVGSLTYWLAFLDREQAPSRSLYDADVQRQIMAELRKQREDAEMERYAAQLRERWVADDLEAMRRRLVAIANERYLR